jgi:hypothetical protein
MKKRYLIIAIPFLIYLYFKFCNRTIPIEFKFEYIKNDSVFFSSNKNLEEYGNKTGVVRYGFICPISNNDLTFPNQTNNEIILEYDPRYYTKKFEHKLLVRKEKNRFFYRTLISIGRNNEIYKPSTVTDKETIELIKQKGDSLECKIGVLFYFFPPPKYSKSFFLPSEELINYIENKK